MECFLEINSRENFRRSALKLFRYQYHNNAVYRSYCNLVDRTPNRVKTLKNIPFLPIQFFKSHRVVSFSATPEKTFLSSTTTGQLPSKHHVKDLNVYKNSFRRGFKIAYGSIENYAVLALLPAYLERKNSSLVYMAADMIKRSNHPKSGFYLDEWQQLISILEELERRNQKTLLLGVSFALLELVSKRQFSLKNTIIMETGGMKGRGKEMVKNELHQLLRDGFGVSEIHSEYGMTELMSQAYSKGNGIFECPPWMQVSTRAIEDPFQRLEHDKTGGLNFIDLANVYSCAFIATQDLGKCRADGTFEVLGRFDNAEVRGCNLLVL